MTIVIYYSFRKDVEFKLHVTEALNMQMPVVNFCVFIVYHSYILFAKQTVIPINGKVELSVLKVIRYPQKE